jgi:DNA-binding CsgD family transcriptional regulator
VGKYFTGDAVMELNESVIVAMFGLSKAEIAVASSLASGLSPKRIAQKTGRSYETIRSQMKQLFQKTDTHRQGELVALLMRVTWPSLL